MKLKEILLALILGIVFILFLMSDYSKIETEKSEAAPLGCMRSSPRIRLITTETPDSQSVRPGGSVNLKFSIENPDVPSVESASCAENYYLTFVVSTDPYFNHNYAVPPDMAPVQYSYSGLSASFRDFITTRYKKFKIFNPETTANYLLQSFYTKDYINDSGIEAKVTGLGPYVVPGPKVIYNPYKTYIPSVFYPTFHFDINPRDTAAGTYYVKLRVESDDYIYTGTREGVAGVNNIDYTYVTPSKFIVSGTPLSYTINSSAGPGGSISPSGTKTYLGHDNATYEIEPNSGYKVTGFRVDGVEQSIPRDSGFDYEFRDIEADHTISATFTRTYTINASAQTGGTIIPSGAVTVDSGGSRTFTRTVNSGYRFLGYTVDGVNLPDTQTSYSFTNVTADHSIIARFIRTYTLTAASPTNGKIQDDPLANINCGSGSTNCTKTYDQGSIVNLKALANSGYVLGGWGGNCAASGTNINCSLTMDANKTISVNFSLLPTTYKVRINSITGNGSVLSSPSGINCQTGTTGTCEADFNIGSSVTLTASPITGWNWGGWGGTDCSGSGSVCNLTMNSDKSASATFTNAAIITSNNLKVTVTWIEEGVTKKVELQTGLTSL